MTSNHDISGTQVISIDTGERLGTIDQIVLEPEGRKLAAFTVQSLTGGGILSPEQPTASWLMASDIHAIGPDAITVNSPSCLRETIERKDYLLVGDLIHRKLVSEGGVMLGEVALVHFDKNTLDVTGFEVSPGRFKANSQIGLEHMINVGNDVIIVDDSASPEALDAPESIPVLEAGETRRPNVVGDVTAGDQPGNFQVVRKALDGEQVSQQQ